MVVGNGDDLRDQLMNAQAFCPNCGTKLTFEDSARLAKSQGVSENAIMCPDCRKVYNVNLSPDKMTILGEITKYNFSQDNNKAQASGLPADFQKRVSRDKKIIIGALIAVVVLILIAFVTMPSVDYYVSYDSGNSLDSYNDMSASSNINLNITDAHKDYEGWYFVYGKVTPKSANLSDYKSIAIYYDDVGSEIASDSNYLVDDINGEYMLGGVDLHGFSVNHIDIGIIDDDDNLVARTTYYV